MAGKFEIVGNFLSRGPVKVDPILVDILQQAAEATGMNVEAFSGYRPGDKRQHGKGKATDIRIIGDDGKPLLNYQSPETFPQYERLAQAARKIQMEKYPDLEKGFRWGGYFSGGKGKYGAMDLMHFDLGGGDGLGMAGGTWEKGLNPQQSALYPGVKSVGALAYDGQPVQANKAVEAVNTMAGAGNLAGVSANPAQTVSYVAPPFSGQGNFTPLLGGSAQPAQEPVQQQEAAPEPSVAQPAPVASGDDDVLKSWGLEGGGQPAGAAPATDASPDEGLIKAWGLDKTDAAPAAAMATSDEKAPTATPIGLNDAVRSVATGVPIIGGLLNKANAATNALIAPAINPMLEEGNQLKGNTYSERYANSLAEQEGLDAAYAQQHPIANTVGNVVGGVAGTIPMIAAAPGLMGASRSASLGTNMLMGGASGAVIGGTDAGVRSGGDLGAIRSGAELGGAFGVGAPVIGKVIGAGANKLMQGVSSILPKGAAARNLNAAIDASDTSMTDIGNQLQRNARLTPMDVDPNLQQMAMNLANQGGGARTVLNKAVEARMAGAKDAVTDTFDQALGQTPNVKLYLDTLKANTQANAKTAFGDALKTAKPVDVAPVLDDIDAAVGQGTIIPQGPVEQALSRLRSKLANETETLTDAQRLHEVQSQLRIDADTLAKSSSGQDKLVANALRKARQKLIDQIDDASGNKYRPAQKQYADDMSINDAFDKGRQILAGGTSGDAALQNRPEYWDDWVKNASQPEIDAAKVGARVAIDQQINSVRNAAAKGAAIPEVGFSKGRLEILLGKQETAKLAQTLADEQKIAQTNAKLFAGSQTAPRQAVNKLTEVTQVMPGISITTPMAGLGGYQLGGLPGAAAGVGLSLTRMGAQAALRARDVSRNRLMAEALSGDVATLRDALAIGSMPGRVGQKVGQGVNRLMTASGPAATEQINQNVPVKLPPTRKVPLEITVRPRKK